MTTLFLLSALVLIHELGHFLAARKFGVKVEEFGIGLPPRALTITKTEETEYTLNWLPIGGFVRLLGEDTEVGDEDQVESAGREGALWTRPRWQRAVILLAGVGMNFAAGIVLFSLVYSVSGVPRVTGSQVLIDKVAAGSPAELAGMAAGEVVRRVGDKNVANADEFVELIEARKGEAVSLYLAKMGTDGRVSPSSHRVTLIPRENPPEGEGALGVEIVTYPQVIYEKKSWYTAPFYGVVEGMKEAYGWTRYMLQLFVHPRELWQGLGGPVKVFRLGQEQAAAGWLAFARFGGVIAFNLAVFNLLPLPALDGGRLLFLGIEKLAGRKRTAKYEKWVHAAGMAALVLLLLLVTVRDLVG